MMKAAKSITELAQELERQQARKVDFVLDTRQLKVLTGESGTEIVLPEEALGAGLPSREIRPTQHMLRQLGTHLGVRSDLFDRLRGRYPVQFDHLINGMLLNEAEAERKGKAVKRMLRCYAPNGGGGESVGRAMVSDGYRRIDNYQLALAVLPIINKIPDVQIPACEVTETRMYIKVIAPNKVIDLNALRRELGDHKMLPETPDYIQPGFIISNSEVGAGSLTIDRMIYRLLCSNGAIVERALGRRHVGSRIQTDDEDFSIYRQETVAADDTALMMKVQDGVSAAVDEARFEQLAAQFAQTATTERLVDPIEQIKPLGQAIGFTEGEGKAILEHLLAGGDLTQFGAINAITRAAQDVEDYDRSVQLEEVGGSLMRMVAKDWNKLAATVA